ncbi:hypothetical protein BDW74DRAFT_173105 [Aspergillus multicolor]|uniref:protein kinase family protein n=1 Tax=Aspergillus multicolor TaxID=41759 RepID=UPI003CCCCD9B
MSSSPVSLDGTSSIELKSYREDSDFRALGLSEPWSRSYTLVYHYAHFKWWVTVTFQGEVYRHCTITKPQRRKDFAEFVRLIDYVSLTLLDDTVTEVILEEGFGAAGRKVKFIADTEASNDLVTICNPFALLIENGNLTYSIREDPQRVVYPSCDEFSLLRCIHMEDLVEEKEIKDGVFKVRSVSDGTPYILKSIDQNMYFAEDTETIRHELRNLQQFRGTPFIVQPVGIAVAPNPYQTLTTYGQSMVVTGALVEYYSGGSLKNVLAENSLSQYADAWKRWPLQVATALHCLHEKGVAHMDIKPSNVVLDTNGNAILIDISGSGAFTFDWLAPELRGGSTLDEPSFEARRSNDIWAYGKLLLELTRHAEDSGFKRHVEQIAGCLMAESIHERMSLVQAISEPTLAANS